MESMQKTKRRQNAEKPGGKSIFVHILIALLVVLSAELLLMLLAIWNSSVIQKLDQNAVDILNQQVTNRTYYLQRRFLEAQKLDDVAAQVNAAAEKLLAEGAIALDTLDQSSENAQPLMDAIAPQLVTALRLPAGPGPERHLLRPQRGPDGDARHGPDGAAAGHHHG